MILSRIIKPISPKDQEKKVVTIAKGVMSYDPSDYEKMCLFASAPLVGGYELLLMISISSKVVNIKCRYLKQQRVGILQLCRCCITFTQQRPTDATGTRAFAAAPRVLDSIIEGYLKIQSRVTLSIHVMKFEVNVKELFYLLYLMSLKYTTSVSKIIKVCKYYLNLLLLSGKHNRLTGSVNSESNGVTWESPHLLTRLESSFFL